MNDDYSTLDFIDDLHIPSLELTPRPPRKSGPKDRDDGDAVEDVAIDATIKAKEATERRLMAENLVLRANVATLLARVAEADATVAAMESRVTSKLAKVDGRRKEIDAMLGRMRARLASFESARKAAKNRCES